MNLLSVSREVGEFRKRYKWMAFVASLAFLVLLSRIFYLQVVRHEHFATLARENIVKTVRLPATRGIIRDAVGRVIATNRPAYKLYITPARLRGPEALERIYDLLELPVEERSALTEKLRAVPARRRTHQIEVLSELSRDQLAAMETHERELPAVDVVALPRRTYPYGALSAHAVGYLNEISSEELEEAQELGYRAGDRVGRSGIERAWEAFLRGRRGYRRVFVDARGRRARLPPRPDDVDLYQEPLPGRDLTLTLDMELMRTIERAFRGHPSGAVVVVEVETGKVRALFSKPTYDLNEMSGSLSHERARELNENPFRPLIDKTLFDSYFPGSTFKPISALAGLEDGHIETLGRVDCPGFYLIGRRRYRCNNVHKETDLHAALVQSCNVYFWKLAELVGMDRLAHFAKQLGLASKSGIGINTETPGFIPTRQWYEDRGEKFRIGYTLNTAIGQGNTRVTLIQLALAYAALANSGTLYVPQLVDSVLDPGGAVLESFAPRVRREVAGAPESFALIQSALKGVVNDLKGTAHGAKVDASVLMSGKTGTAQVSRRIQRKDDPKRAWYYNRDHAWFAGWAPADEPEIAIVVLIEHGGGGGKHAAPIATRVVHEYLGDRVPQALVDAASKPGGKR